MSSQPDSDSPLPPPIVLKEVKYSLPLLLEELKAERAASTFSMEKLDQKEIGKLFKAKGGPRVKSK